MFKIKLLKDGRDSCEQMQKFHEEKKTDKIDDDMKKLAEIITSKQNSKPNSQENQASELSLKKFISEYESAQNSDSVNNHEEYLSLLSDDLKKVLAQISVHKKINLDYSSEKNNNILRSFATDICQTTRDDPSHVIGFTFNFNIYSDIFIYVVLDFDNYHRYIALEFVDEKLKNPKLNQKDENSDMHDEEEQFRIELLDIYWLSGSGPNRALLVVFSVTFSSEVEKIFLAVVDFPAEYLDKEVRLYITSEK